RELAGRRRESSSRGRSSPSPSGIRGASQCFAGKAEAVAHGRGDCGPAWGGRQGSVEDTLHRLRGKKPCWEQEGITDPRGSKRLVQGRRPPSDLRKPIITL